MKTWHEIRRYDFQIPLDYWMRGKEYPDIAKDFYHPCDCVTMPDLDYVVLDSFEATETGTKAAEEVLAMQENEYRIVTGSGKQRFIQATEYVLAYSVVYDDEWESESGCYNTNDELVIDYKTILSNWENFYRRNVKEEKPYQLEIGTLGSGYEQVSDNFPIWAHDEKGFIDEFDREFIKDCARGLDDGNGGSYIPEDLRYRIVSLDEYGHNESETYYTPEELLGLYNS